MKVTPQRGMGFDKIAERIYQYSEVDSVFLMSGGYILRLLLKERPCARQLFVSEKLSTLDLVLSTATHFVLKKYKEHGTVIADPIHEKGS